MSIRFIFILTNFFRMKPGVLISKGSIKLKNIHPGSGVQADDDEQAKKYEHFLKAVACSLGLSEIEATMLAGEVCALGRRFSDENNGLNLRLWLSKQLIRNCVFIISSAMFGKKEEIAFYADAGCRIPLPIRKLPLSFRTVYLLVHHWGFRVEEVAILLNSTPLQVRERLLKANMRLQR